MLLKHNIQATAAKPGTCHPSTCTFSSHGLPLTSTSFCCCLAAQSFLTLRDPMVCSPPGSSVYGISQARNTGVGCHFLLQRIFPAEGSNLFLLHRPEDSLPQSPWEAFYFLNIFLLKTYLSPLNQNLGFKKSRICVFCSHGI